MHPARHIVKSCKRNPVPLSRFNVVQDNRAIFGLATGPIPLFEGSFEGLLTEVAVQISIARPGLTWIVKIDFDARRRRDWQPPMKARGMERGRNIVHPRWGHAHPAFDAFGHRHANLIDRERDAFAVPRNRTRTDGQLYRRPPDVVVGAFGHRPMFAARSIQGNIDRAVIERLGGIVPTRKRVIRRKNISEHGDYSDGVLTIATQRVEIPPGIAIPWNRGVERISERSCVAASLPEIAAIGTPGPGCTLPPAR